jgi:hypothetical protein
MTPDKEKEILAILTMGGSRNVAADYVGIAQGTLHDCIKRNADFSERVKNAEAKGQIRHLKKVSESDQWQASAWMLERKWPNEFGRRERLEHTSPDGSMSPKEIDVSKLSDAALKELMNVLRSKAD